MSSFFFAVAYGTQCGTPLKVDRIYYEEMAVSFF